MIDRKLFARSFGILGPAEAVVSLAAFVVSFVAVGWSFGESFPAGTAMLAASGAAFSAVVFGQVANVFACRSTVRFAWQIPLRINRLLIVAVLAELGMLAAFLYIPPLAHLLGQSPPVAAGFLAAVLAAPAVLAVDTLQKLVARQRRSGAQATG